MGWLKNEEGVILTDIAVFRGILSIFVGITNGESLCKSQTFEFVKLTLSGK